VVAVDEVEHCRNNEHHAPEHNALQQRQFFLNVRFIATCNVEIVIDTAKYAERKHHEERKIYLTALQQRVIDKSHVGKRTGKKYCRDDRSPDENASHRRRPEFILVIRSEDRRIAPIESLNTQL